MTHIVSTEAGSAPRSYRSGPLGRFLRLALGVAAAVSLLSLVDARGSARFRNPHVLSEPSVWFLDALMLVAFVVLVGAIARAIAGQRIVRRALVIAAAVAGGSVVSAGTLGLLVYGSVWGFPLADLVWWFDIAMLGVEFLAFVLAFALGTPGCEIGVWPELIARLRGGRSAPVHGLACIIGLHLLDEWEAQHHVHLFRHAR